MKFFGRIILFCPAAYLLAQNPQAPPPKPIAQPQPTVTTGVDNAATKPPVVPPDQVIITVGDVKITAAQFDALINTLPEQYRTMARGSARKQFADNVVKVFVLAAEGRRRKLDETATYRDQVLFADSNVLAGITNEELGKEYTPDEAETRKYYDEHKSDFEQVRARHILIRMQGSPLSATPGQKELTEAEAMAKAQELRKRIVAGEDFAKVAEENSDDTQTRVKGGDLGFFHRHQMVPSFDQAAFTMKPGELSEPVKSPFGYHLIKVEEHQAKSFEEAKPELEQRMRPQQAQKAIEDLVKKATVILDPVYFGLAAK